MKKTRGFTLIELLVVIAIIGLLSSVVLASLNAARNKAYDAKRRSDLNQIRTALEIYYDNHGKYPSTGGTWYTATGGNGFTTVADWIPGLVADNVLPFLPQDPLFPSKTYTANPCVGSYSSEYVYISNSGTGYKIMDHCAGNSSVTTTNASDPLYDSARPTWSWKYCTGAECSL